MTDNPKTVEFVSDVLVIGTGIAGLFYAIKAAEKGLSINIVTKTELKESNTKYAQGGIAAVAHKEDSFEAHIEDTLKAGDGLCKQAIVELCVNSAPERIQDLMKMGINFSLRKEKDFSKHELDFDLGREGGHSFRRIFHAGDITGEAIVDVLSQQVRKKKNIAIYEHHIAIDLIQTKKIPGYSGKDRIVGAYVLDSKSGVIKTLLAPVVVLATGGAGKAYQYTSNPDVAAGDGVAMAIRAGAAIANMEFYQFHPTLHYEPRYKNFLISEALRGEGAELRTMSGEPFMKRYHELGSLAPRDIVARAIDAEMKKSGSDYVLLDISHRSADFIKRRFPNIYKHCLEYGVDMTKQPIPVVPGAHYLCGGIRTDEWGKTGIAGLLAIGETAYTGFHGANRLASNSLLEGLVFAHRAVEITPELKPEFGAVPARVPKWDSGHAVEPDEMVVVSHNWKEIRRLMWNYVGIVRSDKRLIRARRRLANLEEEIRQFYWDFILTRDLIELRNLVTVAQIIVESALARRENRGLHYNLDCIGVPKSDEKIETIVRLRHGGYIVSLEKMKE